MADNTNIMRSKIANTTSRNTEPLSITPNDLKLIVKDNIDELNASLGEAKKLFMSVADDAKSTVNSVNAKLEVINQNQQSANKTLEDIFQKHARRLADDWSSTINEKSRRLETAATNCTSAASTTTTITGIVLIIMLILNFVGIIIIKSTYNDINHELVGVHQLLKKDVGYWYNEENQKIYFKNLKEAQHGK